MIRFEKCPVCRGEMVEKDVGELFRGGDHVAVMALRAEVCLHCGKRLCSKETIDRFQEVRAKLSRQEVSEFQPLGRSFEVVN